MEKYEEEIYTKGKKEWNLSDELWNIGDTGDKALVVLKRDVKEFIRKLKEDFCTNEHSCDNCGYCNVINKLAGEGLNGR